MKQQKKALGNDLVTAVSLIGDREEQQDSCGAWANEEACLMVVADGAGGHIGGARASKIVIRQFEELWKTRFADLNADPASVIGQTLLDIHEKIIRETGGGQASQSGKAAAVALFIVKNRYFVAHVGDCRMYHFSLGNIIYQTCDDSVLQVLLDSGRIEPFEAYRHPDQSKLTQALGSTQKITPNISEREWERGDAFLLCCDGFWQELHPNEISALSLSPEESMEEMLEDAAKLAIGRCDGSSDNVTVITYLSRPKGFVSRLLNQIFNR